MRRSLAILAILALALVGVGAASGLDITNTPTLQAGFVDDLVCDEDGVTLHPITEFDYWPDVIYGLRVSDIDSDCYGLDLWVVATDSSGDILERGKLEGIGSSSVLVPFDDTLDPVIIEDFHVQIES